MLVKVPTRIVLAHVTGLGRSEFLNRVSQVRFLPGARTRAPKTLLWVWRFIGSERRFYVDRVLAGLERDREEAGRRTAPAAPAAVDLAAGRRESAARSSGPHVQHHEQGNDGSMATLHASSSRGAFTKVATYAIQALKRLPLEATNVPAPEAHLPRWRV
jgi:hypothetical protein